MKNPVIFTPSNAHLLAGHLWPYHGKGFFHAYTPSEVYKKTAACLYRAGSAPVARLTGVFDSDTWQVAFFVCLHSVKCRTHHATSRNHTAHSKANSTHTFRAPLEDPQQDGQAPCTHRSRFFTAFPAIQRVFRANGAGQLPASITCAACPPGGVFPHLFC